MTSKLRIALLGAGIFVKNAHLPSIKANSKSFDLVAVYSRSHSSADSLVEDAHRELSSTNQIAIYVDEPGGGLDALLSDETIDAVIIALPITTQPSIIERCLRAGKHVLSEKPVAPDVSTAQTLIKAYEERYAKAVVWHVAEQYVLEPGFIHAANLIKDSIIGEVIFFRLSLAAHVAKGSKYHATSWRTVPNYQGGFLLDGGVHSAALLRVILGDVSEASARSSLGFEHLAPHDTIHSVLKLTSGVSGTFSLSFGSAPTYSGSDFVIAGTKGHLEVTQKQTGPRGVTVTTYLEGKQLEEKFFPMYGVEEELANFATAIASGGDPNNVASPSEAFKDLALIETCLKSDGNMMKIPML